MSSLGIINRIAAKIAPGRPPAYFEAHVLKALELVGYGKGIGRQKLSKELGVGEGTIRTLVRRLKEEGLVDASRRGMTLTKAGVKVLSDLRSSLEATQFPETSLTVGLRNYAVLVKGSADQVKRGVEQRDAALLAGAKGATTLLYDGERLHLPGLKLDLDNSTADFLLEHLKPEPGDVIIIGTADTLISAEIGAKSAALKLLKETTTRPASA